MVNDNTKPDHVMPQNMYCVISHFVYHIYSFSSTIKQMKDMISYKQQHGMTSMKKHILVEHLNI
jgi:hypothetical protein